MNMEKIIEYITDYVNQIINGKELELYYVEFFEEDGDNFLRITIDSKNGISHDDCEAVSRPLSAFLDEKDLISVEYILEVSSPGIERTLYNDTHLNKYIGNEIIITLNSAIDGKRKLEGTLISFDTNTINIQSGGKDNAIPRKSIKQINLKEII